MVVDECYKLGAKKVSVEWSYQPLTRSHVKYCKESVLGAGVTITSSTKIIDVTGPEPVEYKGYVPPRSVVIPGSYKRQYPAGEYSVGCALIIGQRKESTDKKTSLNDALREFGVSV